MSWLLRALLVGLYLTAAVAADGLPDRDAFGRPMPGIDSAVLAKFNYGLGLFRRERSPVIHADGSVSGPGPLYNATSCAACHLRDGRGAPVDAPGATRAMVFALVSPNGPDPTYGAQLQDQSIAGVIAEGVPAIEWMEEGAVLADGTQVSLRRPEYRIDDLAYGPLDPQSLIDARIANPLVGLGLLAAVDQADILALADPQDRDGDGISGIANMVMQDDHLVLGRFGWKATMPDLVGQTRKAARLDMGLSVPGAPSGAGDCTSIQVECRELAGSVPLELSENDLTLIAHYVAHLRVPERRPVGGSIGRGEALFAQIGCNSCHLGHLRTAPTATAAFADRIIAPFTDLLLHDMGPVLASGSGALRAEWRTPPLWGIGLTEAVSGQTFFLHDGRARNLTEAIMWHGGEADAAKQQFARLDATARRALLDFLRSL